ncbi:MAG TPA: hypothetical protein VGX51_02085 [Solirubrobacteraceae bacterium]|jgi:hypothetical protein|nr:hypothetical protein [Solirubrobacteraceae bacterium]
MNFRRLTKHKLVAGLIAVAVLGGAGAAVAATQSSSSNRRQAYLNDAAKHLGVSPRALSSALQAAAIDHIEAALADGRLTQSQANELKKRVHEGRAPLFGHGGLGRGRLHVGVGRAGVTGVAARYLGISPEALLRERQSHKSLAQIAEATPGKSAAGLKAAILAQAKERLDAAVGHGRISSKQESELLPRISSRVQALLQRTGPRSDGPRSGSASPPANGQRGEPPLARGGASLY